MNPCPAPAADLLQVDPEKTCQETEATLRRQVLETLRRKGAVVGLSGGVDSSVVAALCVRALGKERVLGLFMPEADSSPDSLRLGRAVAATLGIRTELEDIRPMLESAACYRRRDKAIRTVVPEFGPGYKCKLVLPNLLEETAYPIYSIVVESPSGQRTRARLTADAYLGVVAATNFKQRTRKMIEYYWADRFNFAVAGTPNRLEYDQGFFVKNGDGAADFKPIAHLYKSQVYQLAAYLGIPEEIQRRPPTTDTYSLSQSQEEFYFTLPYQAMDICLYGRNNQLPAEQVAGLLGFETGMVERVYRMIDAKRRATRYLQLLPLLAGPVPEIEH